MRNQFPQLFFFFTPLNPHHFILGLESVKRAEEIQMPIRSVQKSLNTKDLPDLTTQKKQKPNSVFLIWKKTNLPGLVFGRELLWKYRVPEIEEHIISLVFLLKLITTEATTIERLQNINCCFPSTQEGMARLRANERKRKYYPLCCNKTKGPLVYHYIRHTLLAGRGDWVVEIKGCKFYKCKSSKVGQLVSCKLGSIMKHVCWSSFRTRCSGSL